jgi:hypothetical protein
MRYRSALVGAVTGLLLAPAAATAAPAKPVPITGGVANVAPTTVVLKGQVNPRQAATTYFFQYGPTRLYGGTTAAASAGAGNRRAQVAVAVGGLAPATVYHYRLVAQNAKGMTFGKNRRFRTRRQPLGLTLGATPNPILAGRSTTLGGTLTGTGSAGRQVVLQSNPWPYTQGFVSAVNAQVTNAQGGFAFPILSQGVTTQYRVLMPHNARIVSPVVVVGTAVSVTMKVKVRRGERRGRLRFSGHMRPGIDGHQVLIQKLGKRGWNTIATTFARHASASASRYVKRVRQRRGGRYRVVANINAQYVPSAARSKRIRRVRD